MSFQDFIVKPGDVITKQDVIDLFTEVRNRIGTGDAARGLVNRDIPVDAGIPMDLLQYPESYTEQQWGPCFALDDDIGWPPTTRRMTFDGTLRSIEYSATANAVLVVGKGGKVVYTSSILTTNWQPQYLTLATPAGDETRYDFSFGQSVSISVLTAGTTAPAIGSTMKDQRWAVASDFVFHYRAQ